MVDDENDFWHFICSIVYSFAHAHDPIHPIPNENRMYATQVAEQESELAQAKESLAAAKARAKEMAAKHKELVAQEAGLRKQREQKLKVCVSRACVVRLCVCVVGRCLLCDRVADEAHAHKHTQALEAEVKKAKKEQEKAAAACKAAEQRRKMLGMELKELEGENSSVAGQLQGAREGLDKLREEVEAMEAQLKAKREDYEAAKYVPPLGSWLGLVSRVKQFEQGA